MIQIIAIDLDDTLLNEELSIPPENISAIKKAEERGVHVVLSSGRSPQAMKRYAEQLDMHGREGYLVSNNGATIMSTGDWEVIVEHHLDVTVAAAAWELVRAAGFPMQYYLDGKIYSASPTNSYSDKDSRLTGQPQVVLDDFTAGLSVPRTKFVIPGDPERLPALECSLKERFGDRANIFTSKPYFLEIQPAHADKGSALEWISGQLGVSRSDILAIGDSMNDYGMLSFAGHSAAMSNAVPGIREVAEYITRADHNDGGVAEAIRHFLG